MRFALISDIHANLEAMEAVLRDIDQHRVDKIHCLGDVVGYGPNPRECLDAVMQLSTCILGNHDLGALLKNFGPRREHLIAPSHRIPGTKGALLGRKNCGFPV